MGIGKDSEGFQGSFQGADLGTESGQAPQDQQKNQRITGTDVIYHVIVFSDLKPYNEMEH